MILIALISLAVPSSFSRLFGSETYVAVNQDDAA